jgi:hypothetical protein
MMYGAISTALLILLSSAAFQLGTNMPILQEVDLPGGNKECVSLINCDGHHGVIQT